MLMLSVSTAIAQSSRTIIGTVTDNNGEPLIGATVKVPGIDNGTVTDMDGNFTINVSASAKNLEVSYVGFTPQTVKIKEGKMAIRLAEDTNQLEQVVVIGYGSVKKGDVITAVAQVKGDKLADRPVSSIATALQGELAGVEIRSNSGAPGANTQITVRGATSINESGNSNPLFVVDGIPMDEDFDLITINPQDIESIEVLKDASSSAIYGSRGANGVVLITSKKGTGDGLNVNFSANYSISTPERYMDIMSPEEWIAWRTKANNVRYVEKYADRGATMEDDFATRVGIIGSVSNNYVNDPRWSMPNYGGLALVDWQKELFQEALAQNYSLSVNSGNKNANFRASVGYLDQEGIVMETSFKRLNLKLAGQATIKDRLTIGVDLSSSIGTTDGGSVDGKDNVAQRALTLSPIVEPASGLMSGSQPYKYYFWASNAASPVANMKHQSYNQENIRINASAFARYKIFDGLTAEIMGSWIFNNKETHRFIPSTLNNTWATNPEGFKSTGTWNGNRSQKYMGQGLLTFNKEFGMVHRLNVVAGWSVETTDNQSQWNMNATQFPNNALEGFNMNNVVLTAVNAQYNTDVRMLSYFARAEYGYDSRYLFNVSIRRDGSSRFGKNNKWGTFPAASAAWRANNESFWDKDWAVNQLKFRISWGTNGSNSIPTNAADGLLGSSNYSSNGTLSTGYVPTSTQNPDLGWQKTDSWNFGVDLGIFKNRISLSADYYIKDIRDMLYQITLPANMGYKSGYTNVGSIRTKGVELELKTENLSGALKWTTNLILGYSKNEVTDLGANSTIYTGYSNSTQVIEVGRTAGEYYLYDAVGVYQSQADLENYPIQKGTSAVGGVRYRDVNNDGEITVDDRTYMGSPQPTMTYGLTNTFKYKNFDLSFLITAQTGGKVYGALGRAFDRQGMGTSVNALRKWENMFFSEEDPGDGVTPKAWLSGSSAEYDDRWLYSSDFIKLKNITLGYRFKFPKTAFVSQLRLTASVENVFMIDSYEGGFSPETNNTGSRISSYDYGAYPLARTFSLGASLQF